MTLVLRIFMIGSCLLLATYVVHLVKHERLQLRYSLLWLVLAIAMLLCALFPRPLFSIAAILGFEAPASFIFFAGLILLLLISLSLSSIVSKQMNSIKNLTQRIALLEHQLNNSEKCKSETIEDSASTTQEGLR